MRIERTCKKCKETKSVLLFKGPRILECYKCYSNRLWKNKTYTKEQFKLKCSLQAQLVKAVKNKYFKFNPNYEKIIGIDAAGFRKYMESKFDKEMNWENYGKRLSCFDLEKWQIDHIIPISSQKNINDIKKLFHYTNLQPLWHAQNSKKSKKLPEQLKKEAEEREQRKNS